MYALKMGTRDFNSWYQEWSTHAERANVDENTRMFAFRNCIPQSLHQKIILHDPQPTMMMDLVEKARTLDRAYQIWGPSNRGTGTQRRSWNARGTAIDESGETQINLYEVGDRRPQSSTRGKRLSREEKDRRFKANLCFFCGKPGHRVKDCDVKKNMSQGRPSGGGRNTRTHQLATDETEPQDEAAPAKYNGPREAQVARFYPSMGDHYDIIRPKSAPVNEDF
jgi:Zinc knuckle